MVDRKPPRRKPNSEAHLVQYRLKKLSLIERRSNKGLGQVKLSLNTSVKRARHPTQLLKDGQYDIDSSHLVEVAEQ